MAKFTVEVELDWMDEENIDDAIKEKVIANIQSRMADKAQAAIEKQLKEQASEKVDELIETFIERMTHENLGAIQIPKESSRWRSEVTFISLSEFIGEKFEKMMTEKTLTKSGGKPDYRDNATYSVIEYLTKGHIADELNAKIVTMIQTAKKQAEESLIKNLEQNLQQQLNADMIKRLNIPQLLQNLSNTIGHEGEI